MIRDCGPEDFDDIFPLLEELWPDLELDREKMRGVYLDCLDKPGYRALCAEVGEDIVGFCDLVVRPSLWQQGRLSYVEDLVVTRRWRRRGIGGELLERAVGLSREMGALHVMLDSALRRGDAHRLYQSKGFMKSGYTFGKDL